MNRATKSSWPRVSCARERRLVRRPVGRAVEVAHPVHQPDQRPGGDGQVHQRDQDRLLERGVERGHLGGPDRVGVGRVGQDQAGHPSAQRLGEDLAEGQGDHPADAVADQHGRPVAGEGEHGLEVGRELLQAVIVVVGLLREAQARLVPDDQAEPAGEVLLLVEPLGAVGPPAVGPDDRRGVGRPVALDPELAPVGPADRVDLAGPVARGSSSGSTTFRRPASRLRSFLADGRACFGEPGPRPTRTAS